MAATAPTAPDLRDARPRMVELASIYGDGTIGLRCYWMGRVARAFPEGPDAVTFDLLVAWLAEHQWAPQTRRAVYASVRGFWAWMVETGRCSTSPAVSLPRVRTPRPRPRPAPEADFRFALAIADRVAPGAGLVFTADEQPWLRSTLRGIRESLGLLAFGLVVGIAGFALGFIPVVGSAAAFVLAAVVGGSLLTLELTSYPLSRVGITTLRERRRLAAARRSLTLGFGVTCYLVCLIPLGAVVAMPSLVAGGTLLAARLAPSMGSEPVPPGAGQPAL